MESSSPPFMSRVATPRQRRGLKTFLGPHRILERHCGIESPWAPGAPSPVWGPPRHPRGPPSHCRASASPAWCCTQS
nr:hypothetical protein HJG63_001945 [Rousettus aegyptiacus]